MSCKAASPDIKPLILCLLSLLFLGRSMSFASLSCLLISFRFFFLFSFSCQRGRWRFSLFSLFYTLFLSHLSVERSVIDLFYSLFFFSAYCITVLYSFSFCFTLYMSANYLSCLYHSDSSLYLLLPGLTPGSVLFPFCCFILPYYLLSFQTIFSVISCMFVIHGPFGHLSIKSLFLG